MAAAAALRGGWCRCPRVSGRAGPHGAGLEGSGLATSRVFLSSGAWPSRPFPRLGEMLGVGSLSQPRPGLGARSEA